jgi:hypothetical protein
VSRVHLLTQRRKSRRSFKIPKEKLAKLGRIVILISLALLPIIVIPRLIPISGFKCESQRGECSNFLKDKLSQVSPTNFIQTKSRLAAVMSREVFVKSYSIRFALPPQFIVYAIEREPVVALAKEGATSDFAYIDNEGYITGIWQETQLPILVIDKSSQFQVGQKIPDELLYAVNISFQSYKKYDSRLSLLKADSIEVDLPIGTKAIFPRSGEPDVLFGSLSLILSRLNTEELALRIDKDHLPSSIDLRYKNPVLK